MAVMIEIDGTITGSFSYDFDSFGKVQIFIAMLVEMPYHFSASLRLYAVVKFR